MAVLRDGAPSPRCRCLACRQVRARLFGRLSPRQRACFAAVDRRLPRHPEDVKARAGVTATTIDSLVAPPRPGHPLLARVDLRRTQLDRPIPFLILTDLGRDVANPELRA